jgi:hypothetical protein
MTTREPLFIRPRPIAIPMPVPAGPHPDDDWFAEAGGIEWDVVETRPAQPVRH